MLNVYSHRRGPYKWPFIYFHNEAEKLINENYNGDSDEDWVAPDLVSSDVSHHEVPDGETEVMIHGQHPAILFKWLGGRVRHGLICLAGDERAIQYARKCLARRQDYI